MRAVILHETGKPITTKMKANKLVSYGHDKVRDNALIFDISLSLAASSTTSKVSVYTFFAQGYSIDLWYSGSEKADSYLFHGGRRW